jgi:hypothetical protein
LQVRSRDTFIVKDICTQDANTDTDMVNQISDEALAYAVMAPTMPIDADGMRLASISA